MTAAMVVASSSSTVVANLAYVVGALVVAVIAGVAVWLHHRQPKSVDANMASFRKGLRALAPDTNVPMGRTEAPRVRAVPGGLTHVRIDSQSGPGPGGRPSDAEEATDEAVGGQPG